MFQAAKNTTPVPRVVTCVELWTSSGWPGFGSPAHISGVLISGLWHRRSALWLIVCESSDKALQYVPGLPDAHRQAALQSALCKNCTPRRRTLRAVSLREQPLIAARYPCGVVGWAAAPAAHEASARGERACQDFSWLLPDAGRGPLTAPPLGTLPSLPPQEPRAHTRASPKAPSSR